MSQLPPDRLVEIRDLLTELIAAPDGPQEAAARRALLDRCRSALADVLSDRDDLARVHAETAEELALWTGSVL